MSSTVGRWYCFLHWRFTQPSPRAPVGPHSRAFCRRRVQVLEVKEDWWPLCSCQTSQAPSTHKLQVTDVGGRGLELELPPNPSCASSAFLLPRLAGGGRIGRRLESFVHLRLNQCYRQRSSSSLSAHPLGANEPVQCQGKADLEEGWRPIGCSTS